MSDLSATDDPHGVLASARGAGATLLEILGTRLRLLGMDLDEQGERFVLAFLLGMAALCLLLFALAGVALLIVLALWQAHGVVAATGVVCAVMAVGFACALLCARTFRTGPRPFEGSIAELEKDLARLRGEP